MIRSPRFLISPRVQVTSPTSWNAIPEGPSHVAGRGVDAAADPVADRDRHALGFRGCVRQAVDDRVFRLGQDPRRAFDRHPPASAGFAVDQTGRTSLEPMAEEPRLAQDAGVLRLGDAIALDLERDVVAEAAAEGAGGVFDGPRKDRAFVAGINRQVPESVSLAGCHPRCRHSSERSFYTAEARSTTVDAGFSIVESSADGLPRSRRRPSRPRPALADSVVWQ